MKIEKVINTLLNVPGITGKVGQRIYPVILPKSQGSPQSYIVFQVISNVPRLTLDATQGFKGFQARVQVNAAARTYSELKALVQSVRDALHLQRGTIAGVNVTSIVLSAEGPEDFDASENVYVQPVDFMVTHRE